ncbi:MAG TPA: serine hydrolase, partial [Thermoanaerobaculia bacterium]
RIWRDPDGSMMAAFRNPEQNAIGRTTQFRVEQDGDTLHFTAQPDVRIDATVSGDGIAVHWPPIDRTIELTRRSVPTVAKYVYRKPPGTGDGWTTARAKDAGMDEAALERIVQRLLDSDPFARRPVLVHSLLIARRGKLVLEEYFHGHGRDEPHDLRSAGKTFASVMLGAAMHRGTHVAPDTGIYDILAGMGPFANPDPRKSQITLAQLMTHTSGLACDDNDDASPGNENAMQSQSKQPDWWKYTLDLPLVHDPGTRYAYCSGGMNLVAAALTTATHTWLPEYFERTIAGPLGFGPHYWNLMPDGEGYLGGGAYVRPRDLLKVGQLYLDGGVWRGKRIVARSWVTQSTQPRVHISPATTGMTPEQFSNSYIEADDAYAWHLSALHDYAASGNGGQLLIVVPDYDLVVVFTAGNYGQGGIWTKFRSEIVPREILPAIRKRPSSAFGTFSPLRGAKEDR